MVQSIPISCVATICSPDDIITVMVEFILKNGADLYPYYICVATICSPDYIITVTVEFILKNGADPYPYHVLPQYAFRIT